MAKLRVVYHGTRYMGLQSCTERGGRWVVGDRTGRQEDA